VSDKYRHTHAERNAMLRDLKQVILRNDVQALMTFLRSHGMKDEHPRFALIVKAFYDGTIDELIRPQAGGDHDASS
jgi:hypothetical protein